MTLLPAELHRQGPGITGSGNGSQEGSPRAVPTTPFQCGQVSGRRCQEPPLAQQICKREQRDVFVRRIRVLQPETQLGFLMWPGQWRHHFWWVVIDSGGRSPWARPDFLDSSRSRDSQCPHPLGQQIPVTSPAQVTQTTCASRGRPWAIRGSCKSPFANTHMGVSMHICVLRTWVSTGVHGTSSRARGCRQGCTRVCREQGGRF